MKIEQFTGKYRWLSNFWLCPVVFEDIKYPSAEHAYQASKTNINTIKFKISNMKSPAQAKKYGRKIKLKPNFNKNRLNIMYYILKQKFYGNTDLGRRLLETDGYYLEEGNMWGDIFWGVSPVGGVGKNYLGHLLMDVRFDLIVDELYNEYLSS